MLKKTLISITNGKLASFSYWYFQKTSLDVE